MDVFWKAIGGSFIALIFGLVLAKRNPDIAVVLNLLACCMLLAVALGFLGPVVEFFRQFSTLSGLGPDNMEILMKATALGMVSQIAAMLCADAGNSALGKGIEIIAVCTILWISLPLLNALVELIKEVIAEL